MIYSRARFASISFAIIGILGMATGNTGCRSAATAALSPSSVEQVHRHLVHNTGANLKETAQTEAVDYIYLTRKLMD